MREQALSEAKLLMRQSEVGVISTLSKNLQGYPFGSVTPFISDSSGKLYFYISEIAQHAKNMVADSHMSLTIFDRSENGDQNEHARVTIIGDGSIVPAEQKEQMLARYVLRFPDAATYEQAHNFNMWQVDIKRVRYIGGFGKIFWLEKEEWDSADAPWDYQGEHGMVTHMDEDHQDAMALILQMTTGIYDESVTMSGVVADGCYLRSNEKNYFVPFDGICRHPGDARKYLVALTQAARAAA